MQTLAEIAKDLNRPVVYLSGLQSRFELPELKGAGYSDAYQAFLQNVVHLRTLGIAEDRLRELWDIEKKLLQLLHADTTGSPTWFLDSCGATTNSKQRLLLTNHDVGVVVHGTGLQLGLNFADTTPELFAGENGVRPQPSDKPEMWVRTGCFGSQEVMRAEVGGMKRTGGEAAKRMSALPSSRLIVSKSPALPSDSSVAALPRTASGVAVYFILTSRRRQMDGELSVLEQRREKTRALKQAMRPKILTERTRLI